jgi:hypothetical protein
MQNIQMVLDEWVRMWNTYDLSQVDKLFLTNEKLTYFSSEREGAIVGIQAVHEHHQKFGFVAGGKLSANQLWLEDVRISDLGSCAVATGIWFFRRAANGQIQRGPVTFVLTQSGNEYRLAHLNFGNYPAK